MGSARITTKTNDLKRARLADQTLQVILETRLTASRRSFVLLRQSTCSLHAARKLSSPFQKVNRP